MNASDAASWRAVGRRPLVGIGVLGGLVALGLAPGPAASSSATAPDRTPVLVELFTSQGCSSCPAADALLILLDAAQPVEGALVIPLSEHVDYWDDLGWRDPFSAPQFTRRQREYGVALGVETPYTPQMVVDGRTTFVGSRRDLAEQAIAEAAASREAALEIRVSGRDRPVRIRVTVTASGLPAGGSRGEADLWVAVTEEGLSTDVTRGENIFRRLRHAAVVRRLETIATVPASEPGPVTGTGEVALDPTWREAGLRLVAVLQERTSRRVLGAAQTTLD